MDIDMHAFDPRHPMGEIATRLLAFMPFRVRLLARLPLYPKEYAARHLCP
jgi:hypothetical protein